MSEIQSNTLGDKNSKETTNPFEIAERQNLILRQFATNEVWSDIKTREIQALLEAGHMERLSSEKIGHYETEKHHLDEEHKRASDLLKQKRMNLKRLAFYMKLVSMSRNPLHIGGFSKIKAHLEKLSRKYPFAQFGDLKGLKKQYEREIRDQFRIVVGIESRQAQLTNPIEAYVEHEDGYLRVSEAGLESLPEVLTARSTQAVMQKLKQLDEANEEQFLGDETDMLQTAMIIALVSGFNDEKAEKLAEVYYAIHQELYSDEYPNITFGDVASDVGNIARTIILLSGDDEEKAKKHIVDIDRIRSQIEAHHDMEFDDDEDTFDRNTLACSLLKMSEGKRGKIQDLLKTFVQARKIGAMEKYDYSVADTDRDETAYAILCMQISNGTNKDIHRIQQLITDLQAEISNNEYENFSFESYSETNPFIRKLLQISKGDETACRKLLAQANAIVPFFDEFDGTDYEICYDGNERYLIALDIAQIAKDDLNLARQKVKLLSITKKKLTDSDAIKNDEISVGALNVISSVIDMQANKLRISKEEIQNLFLHMKADYHAYLNDNRETSNSLPFFMWMNLLYTNQLHCQYWWLHHPFCLHGFNASILDDYSNGISNYMGQSTIPDVLDGTSGQVDSILDGTSVVTDPSFADPNAFGAPDLPSLPEMPEMPDFGGALDISIPTDFSQQMDLSGLSGGALDSLSTSGLNDNFTSISVDTGGSFTGTM